jgi:hypothetical protein
LYTYGNFSLRKALKVPDLYEIDKTADYQKRARFLLSGEINVIKWFIFSQEVNIEVTPQVNKQNKRI